MAIPKRKSDGLFEASDSGPQRRNLVVAADGAVPVSSPVHHFHSVLETAFAPEPEVEKLPGVVRMLIIGGGIVVPWACIFGLAKLVLA